jgi:hypothetical protein
MKPGQLAKEQAKADEVMRKGWSVEDGMLIFNGKGDNLCTEKQYGDFEMYVDWMLDPAGPEADAGIYLRGTPQVQIWDTYFSLHSERGCDFETIRLPKDNTVSV